MQRPQRSNQPRASLAPAPGAVYRLIQEHHALLLILLLSFMMRFTLSGWNSYRLDELYSVKAYGTDYPTVWGGLRALAEVSVHPPLYQFILFYWVKLFGDSEVATRGLSNLYVTAATLFLYLFALRLFAKRVAVASSLLFVLSQLTLQWGLDTRSYAQSLFLSALSSFFLYKYLNSLSNDRSWRRTLLNSRAAALTAVNLGLLFTHYYNAFFFASQGAFILYYFCFMGGRTRIVESIGKAAALYGAQLGLFLAVWGGVMLRTFGHQRGGDFAVDAPTSGPLGLFHSMVVSPNLGESVAVSWFAAILLLTLLFATARAWSAPKHNPAALSHHFALYPIFVTLGPCVVAFVLFWISHAERLEPRYFIVSTAPLMIGLSLALDRGIHLAGGPPGEPDWLRRARPLTRRVALLAAAGLLVMVAARGYEGAAWRKRDFRGIAEEIADLVRGDPRHRYIIYEAATFPRSMLDFYLNRGSPPLSAFGTVISEEETSGDFRFEHDAPTIDQYDYLVLAFAHRRVRAFPQAIARLEQKYPLHARHIDRNDFGYLVFKVHPER